MRAARALPSSARRRRRLRRAPTAANSAATYKPVRRMRKKMTSAATSIGPGHRIPTASARRFQAAQLDSSVSSAPPLQARCARRPVFLLFLVIRRAPPRLRPSIRTDGRQTSSCRPGRGATVAGAWTVVADRDRCGRRRGAPPERRRRQKLTQALAQPVNYFEQSFTAEANVRVPACGYAGRRRATTGAMTRSSCSSRTALTAAARPLPDRHDLRL